MYHDYRLTNGDHASLILPRSAHDLYVALKEAIADTIKGSHFSVDEKVPKQVSENLLSPARH